MHELRVEAKDAAGNFAVKSDTVTFDFTAPKVLSASGPGTVKAGDKPFYRLNVDETLSTSVAPTLVVTHTDGLTTAPFAFVSGTTYLFSLDPPSGQKAGTYSVKAVLEDDVGNAATVATDTTSASLPGFYLDVTTPDVQALQIKNGSRVLSRFSKVATTTR